MSELETIDVVLPFHRDDSFLSQAVRSVTNQIGCKINLILVDDRKDDSKLQLEIPKNAKIIKTNGVGYNAALKTGLDECQSKFVAFQDSDDVSSPNRLSIQLKKMIQEELDLVFCEMVVINKNGRKSRIARPTPHTANSTNEALLVGAYGADSTWLLKTDNLNGFFQYSYQSLDWATALIKFPTMKVGRVEEALYSYRNHPNQMTSSADYFSKAFDEIYPLWSNVNNRVSLPPLSKEDAATIAYPPSGRKWNSEVQSWTIAFLDQITKLNRLNRDEPKNFEAILGQRVLQSIIGHGLTFEAIQTRKYIKSFFNYQTRIQPLG